MEHDRFLILHNMLFRYFDLWTILMSFLCRTLLAFSEQTVGKKFPENASDQEMLEIVMLR